MITNAEQGMYDLYGKNRRGQYIEMAESQGYSERIEKEITWGSVLEAITKVAVETGLGFTVDFDVERATETFRVYKGVDRTDDTSENYIGYFSIDDETVQNIHLIDSELGYKNIAIVAGEGEGEDRIVEIVSLLPVTGEQRREMYVDAREIRSEYQIAHPTGEYDEAGNPKYDYETGRYNETQYRAMLRDKGLEKLLESQPPFMADADAIQGSMLFGRDYFMGDILPARFEPYGVKAKVQVLSSLFADERDGEITTLLLKITELEENE